MRFVRAGLPGLLRWTKACWLIEERGDNGYVVTGYTRNVVDQSPQFRYKSSLWGKSSITIFLSLQSTFREGENRARGKEEQNVRRAAREIKE